MSAAGRHRAACRCRLSRRRARRRREWPAPARGQPRQPRRARRARGAARYRRGARPGRGRLPPERAPLPHRLRTVRGRRTGARRRTRVARRSRAVILGPLLRERGDPSVRPAARLPDALRRRASRAREAVIMDLLATLDRQDPRLARGLGGRFYGVYAALVTDIADPDGQGRVQVHAAVVERRRRTPLRSMGAARHAHGRRQPRQLVHPGRQRRGAGVALRPATPRRPYVIGALWNGQDAPPEAMDGAGRNNLEGDSRLAQRRAPSPSTTARRAGDACCSRPPGGSRASRDGPGAIEAAATATAPASSWTPAGVTVATSLKVTIQAGASVEIGAGAVSVNAGMSTFSGVVQGRHRHHQQRGQRVLHAGRGEHLVAVVPRHDIGRVAPAPLWGRFGDLAQAGNRERFARPAILRFAHDAFMDELLALLAYHPEHLDEWLARYVRPGSGSMRSASPTAARS
ncbi:MAG: hypothetical protein MZW92_40910 [Comamonadaceae bacterium]|nr:hypothetical protein [Comamonadaceae bacterium]